MYNQNHESRMLNTTAKTARPTSISMAASTARLLSWRVMIAGPGGKDRAEHDDDEKQQQDREHVHLALDFEAREEW
jgi:hypothetical protein